MTKDMKNQLKGLLVIISYFLFNYLQTLPLLLLKIDINKMSLFNKTFYLLITEFIYIFIIIYVYRKEFIKYFKDYTKNFKKYMPKYMEYWALAFSLMIVSNFFILTFFPNSIPTNQEAVNNILVKAPFYMITSAVICAPFLEETIFRLSFRKVFKNNIVFIILSGLTFGALHVIGSFTKFADLIFIIPYSIPGFVFAYTLVKSKNIFVPISLHLFHNGIMMLIQVVLLSFI